ncbi:Holliday junction branch migration protein RuvA [Nocardioides lentus]|uniref:Holliday junction branch migration complex subunit RuvA n=1 Tax=Nocardioides lentus TaxID=338077 RepID=A0ABP5B2G4_9ACTN
MISSVRGRVLAVGLSSAVVEVGGVGLQLSCAPGTLAGLRAGEEATLAASLVVREDSLTLYGFATPDERDCFELAQTASGVGPKVAQAMLAVLGPDDLRTAIATEDTKTLTRVPGIGQKGAQRIILELKDRIGPPVGTAASPAAAPPVDAWRAQVLEGLVGLGWSAREADKAVGAVADQAGPEPDVAALLRAALRTLSRS